MGKSKEILKSDTDEKKKDKKKKTDQKTENEAQPEPSGEKEKEKDKKKDSKKKERTSDPTDKKAVKKKDTTSPDRNEHRRLSSFENQDRYKLPVRKEGPQPSHSVRNIVPRLTPEPKKPPIKPKRTIVFDEPSSEDRDHRAVEFYNRSTKYSYTRESLVNLRVPLRKLSHIKLHYHHRPTHAHRKLHFHVRRCKECLQVKDDCVCETMPQKPPKSDWAVLVQPQIENPRTWKQPRIDWLGELEEKSVIDRNKLIEDKFDASHEICCFPFNTFQIFSKREVKHNNYYMKH